MLFSSALLLHPHPSPWVPTPKINIWPIWNSLFIAASQRGNFFSSFTFLKLKQQHGSRFDFSSDLKKKPYQSLQNKKLIQCKKKSTVAIEKNIEICWNHAKIKIPSPQHWRERCDSTQSYCLTEWPNATLMRT